MDEAFEIWIEAAVNFCAMLEDGLADPVEVEYWLEELQELYRAWAF